MTINFATEFIPHSSLPLELPQTEPEIPQDLWHYILLVISRCDNGYCHLSSCATVSRFFLSCCLSVCTRFRIYHSFNLIGSTAFAIQESELIPGLNDTAVSEANVRPRCTIAAVGPDGKNYVHSSLNCDVLYIWGSNNSEKNFRLNLSEIFKSESFPVPMAATKPKEKYGFSQYITQYILSCYPTDEGFLIVTKGGVGIWRYVDKEPVLKAFFAPRFESNSNLISGSAYHQGYLYLINVKNKICRLDLQSDELKSTPVDILHFFSGRLRVLGEHLCHVMEKDNYQFWFKLAINEDDSQNIKLTFDSNASRSLLTISNNTVRPLELRHRNCLVVFGLKDLFLINIKTVEVFQRPINITTWERHFETFIKEDFLCISLGGNVFQIIHIPTNVEYTEKFRPHLDPYLIDENTYISQFDFVFEVEKTILSVVFLKKEKTSRTFSRVAIPISWKPFQY